MPHSQRLASAALGGSRWQTTFKIAIAAASLAITTGILLAVAPRAAEEADNNSAFVLLVLWQSNPKFY